MPARSAAARSASPTAPAALSSATATTSAPNSTAWAASRSGFPPPAARPATRNRSGLRLMTSAAWVPMDPVEPRMTISRGPGCAASIGLLSRIPGEAGNRTRGRPVLHGDRDPPWLPVGAQRHAGGAAGGQPDAQHLVQLDLVALETEPGSGHVQPPDPGGARPDISHRLVVVRVQVRAPGGEGLRIVLAQVLLVPYLEAGVVHARDQVPGALELPVREHVAVDEPTAAAGRLGAIGPGDAVVEQPAARLELAVQEGEVARQVVLADVLGQPDRAHRVESGLGYVAVVEVPDLGQPGQPGLGDGLLR